MAIVVGSGRSWPSCGSFSQEAARGIVLLRAPPALLPAPELLLDPPRDHRCGPVEGGDVAADVAAFPHFDLNFGRDPTVVLALVAAVIIGREITVSALREWMSQIGAR